MLVSNEEICLSYINVSVYFQYVAPLVEVVMPPCGPTAGGTLVTVMTDVSLVPDMPLVCLFGIQYS